MVYIFYNARWYDPALGRFTSADSIIPPGIQGLDRYAYVNNSPMNYVDPSGHIPCTDDGYCGSMNNTSYQKHMYSNAIKEVYDWDLEGHWSLDEIKTIYQTGRDIEKYADSVTGGNGLDWMLNALGSTTIVHSQHSSGRSFAWPWFGGSKIELDQNWMTHSWGASVLFAHELGHVWDINSGFSHSGEMNRDLGGSSWCFFCSPGDDVPQWKSTYHTTKSGDAYGNSARNEYFAEAFSATVFSPADVPSGVAQWIGFQMSIDVTRYLFPGGLQ